MPRAATTADVFTAIAEPRRRQIIELLAGGQSRAVSDLVIRLKLPQPAVSKHLSVLRKVGIVSVTKQGQQRLYQLDAEKLKPVHDWVKSYENCGANNSIGSSCGPNRRRGSGRPPPESNPRRTRSWLRLPLNRCCKRSKSSRNMISPRRSTSCSKLCSSNWGPEFETVGPLPMILEAWPGGRWYRDLGNGAGHFWGHVQVIKPPMLLEICGPLCMSTPAVSHVQYRLTKTAHGTLLQFVHRAIGQIPAEHREGMTGGWHKIQERIRAAAERKVAKS